MHLPLPLFVLAFATIGASLSDHVHLDRLALTYLGIIPALCLAAYSLDELHGRPYKTRFTERTLWLAASVGLVGGAFVAIYLAILVSLYILFLAGLACFFILAYNLELFGGRFHNAAWFGVSWGGLSTYGGYFVQDPNLSLSPLVVSAMASLFSVGILYLTHNFRTAEFSKIIDTSIPLTDLRAYTRQARRLAWSVVRIECYSMVLLALGLIIPKIR
jgi:hypothetical protein